MRTIIVFGGVAERSDEDDGIIPPRRARVKRRPPARVSRVAGRDAPRDRPRGRALAVRARHRRLGARPRARGRRRGRAHSIARRKLRAGGRTLDVRARSRGRRASRSRPGSAGLVARRIPGCIVIDEVAGQLLASSARAALPLSPRRAAGAGVWILSFLLFRLFDVWKPGPVRRLQDLPGGRGDRGRRRRSRASSPLARRPWRPGPSPEAGRGASARARGGGRGDPGRTSLSRATRPGASEGPRACYAASGPRRGSRACSPHASRNAASRSRCSGWARTSSSPTRGSPGSSSRLEGDFLEVAIEGERLAAGGGAAPRGRLRGRREGRALRHRGDLRYPVLDRGRGAHQRRRLRRRDLRRPRERAARLPRAGERREAAGLRDRARVSLDGALRHGRDRGARHPASPAGAAGGDRGEDARRDREAARGAALRAQRRERLQESAGRLRRTPDRSLRPEGARGRRRRRSPSGTPTSSSTAGGARAADVLHLMRRMRDAVRERFGITLSPEVEMLGLKWE